jgi:glycine/D-amino acid oxidase-like deaminating enzyme
MEVGGCTFRSGLQNQLSLETLAGHYRDVIKLLFHKPCLVVCSLKLVKNYIKEAPEVVLREAARLHPKLQAYYTDGRALPRKKMHHYGGWYTMTTENWPLIGPMGDGAVEGAYINCAMSGFGTMAACVAGELCAAWVAGDAADASLPPYAHDLSLQRYNDRDLMQQLHASNKGVL